jgi:hypothetical protein
MERIVLNQVQKEEVSNEFISSRIGIQGYENLIKFLLTPPLKRNRLPSVESVVVSTSPLNPEE